MAAVAHVTAEPAAVAFLPQPEQQLFFDEAAACIHLVEGRMITAVALPHAAHGGGAVPPPPSTPTPSAGASADCPAYDSDSSVASSTARAFLVSEGPPVRHIRSSLDGAFTALHRSARLVEVHCHATGNMFVETAGADKQGRKGRDPRLLGFFWTAPHLVMVTGGGLEMHRVHPSLQALRLHTTLPLQGVQWYSYSPETHMVVLGFGSSGAKLQAIQFSKAGTVKLPLLDLTPPWGSPIRSAQAAAVSAALEGFSAARNQPAHLVGPDTCWVVVLYGRVYCAHHDRGAGLLRLYRLFRDATSLAHQYEVYARQLELSVVDSVLLVHHIDSSVVMLVDVMAAGPTPISSPLPLAVPALRDPERRPSHSSGNEAAARAARDRPGGSAVEPGPAPELPVSTGGGERGAPAGGDEAPPPPPPPVSALQLHYPAWLVDGGAGLVYRLQLDLQAVADSQSDFLRLLAFLQRRRASAAPRRDPAAITLRVLCGLMRDETPLPLLRGAFDVVNAHACTPEPPPQRGALAALAASASTAAARQPRPAVVTQDVFGSAFAVLHAQHRVPPAYLGAALVEVAASSHAHGARVPPRLAALQVDLLLEQGRAHEVALMLRAHPLLDSLELAEHLEQAAAGGRLPQGEALAEQVLLRLGEHEACCRLLLRRCRLRDALRLARRHALVGQLSPAALLEAAAASDDAILFAATHRVCKAQAPHGTLGTLLEAAEVQGRHLQPDQLRALQAALP